MTAKQLKNSILKEAVQGKLIKQNKEDEPASELVKRIKAERDNLIKAGKIKPNKNISSIYRKGNSFYEKIGKEEICIDEELPFEIPKTWEWIRLENLALNYDGKRKPVSVEFRSKQEKIYDYYGATGVIDKVENYIFDGTFVLIGEDGGNFYSDKDVAFIVRGTFWANNHVHVLGIYSGIESYFCYYLNSLNLPAMGLINGIAVPKLNQANLNKILIPLPPIEEQKRIVNKLNELMPLIDEYEKLERELNELDKKFPERLKKSILKEAVQGKLIKQNKEDEPASELVKRIKAEREKLIKAGKIKPNKNISSIYRKGNSFYEKIGKEEICIDEELPFEIPTTWEWTYFKDIVYYSMGKTPPRKEKEYWENTKFAWVSIADLVANGFIYKTKEKVNQYSVDKIFRNKISKAGTLLMSFKLTVGKVSILGIDAYHNEAIISIYPFINDKNIMRDYLFFILPLISQYGNTKSAIKGNTLNSDSLDLLYIPLPPIEEQKRIVEKLDKFMKLCEELKIGFFNQFEAPSQQTS